VTAQHPPRGDVAVLVAAAGMGLRLGSGAPKALRELDGVPLLVHAIRRLVLAPCVAHVAVAAPPGDVAPVRDLVATELPGHITLTVVDGGASRQDSVRSALASVPPMIPVILVHDAARALAPPDLVERVAAAVRAGHSAVIPVLPVVDTIKRVADDDSVLGTVDRALLRAVQTPQGFRREVLEAAHEHAASVPVGLAADVTDDAGLAELLGVRVHCVPGSEAAMKITRPFDLAVARLLLHESVPADRTLSS
jgi:2-C-methyl-D-erythritol 4-phosphate cytidylyltransferase